jgi:hypothetical protein
MENNMSRERQIFKYLCMLFISLSSFVQAYDASLRCYKDLELNFFQPALVSQALSMHHVDQSSWNPILQTLKESSKKVPGMIKAKAKRYTPSPFEPLFIPEIAKQILEETLYEVFFNTIVSYNRYQQIRLNGDDIRIMFMYILSKQEKKMESCFGITKKP